MSPQSKLRMILPAASLFGVVLTACAGDDGLPGAPGPTGPAGANGVAGTNGTNGQDGLPGTNGTNGSTGTPGATGTTGPTGPSSLGIVNVHADLPEVLNVELVSIDIGSATQRPIVTLRVTDGLGRGAVGLRGGSSGNLRFAIAKLTPAANGDPSFWTNYIKSNNRPTSERTGSLVDNQDGTYVYTFTTTVAANPGYDPTLTHRLTIQLSGTLSGETQQTPIGPAPPVNFSHDFVPSGGAVTTTREIVDVNNCNQCHGRLTLHGSRFETKYCVMCHNPDLVDANGNVVDMKVFIHKIHFSSSLPSVLGGRPYELAGEDYSETTLPLEVKHCRKCHNGEANADNPTPQGNNWREAPSRQACGACHDNIDWAVTGPGPTAHSGGPQPNNSQCTLCHGPNGLAPVERAHMTDNATPHNPFVPADLSIFTYEISRVTVDGTGHPIVRFRIMRDTGSGPVSMDLTGTALPATPVTTGGPSFVMAWALPQGGIAEPAEYNNRGRAAAQPLSVSLANLRAGTAGTVTATAGGYYIATFAGTNAFPAGAQMRAVALQGYFSENLAADNPDRGAIGRHAVSVVKGVEGDRARRVVVDNAKCANCHEWLELHGGNRVYETGVCVMCHNPNLTSSGRAADPVLLANQAANIGNPSAEAHEAAIHTIDAYGSDPLQFPEATNSLKDMVHGIHSAHVQTTPYEFVRDRGNSGIYSYDWSEVTYPNVNGNCLACHLPNTYRVVVPASALPTTDQITTGNAAETRADIQGARTNVPNATDLVISPQAATCAACHDTVLAWAHMEQNGGSVNWTRSLFETSNRVESCGLCHGPGRIADVEAMHPLIR
ncbi:MAG: OmcA/MtrC family decaheme c-type cytochrome [Deltaproteobacteria bacterium]|nr:OmcA/MtrC family decaheme c-type cytochrome [Deltaproteobacteria bacterium]